jgi:hypothetical protein
MPAATQNFAGLSYSDAVSGGPAGVAWPPDSNGDAGRNHYIQAVNSAYAIYDKSGTLKAAFTEDSLFATSIAPCNGHSQGEPVVIYDQLHDRWILTHFAFASLSTGPYYQCFAVSKTGDPVAGGWFLYAFRIDGVGGVPTGTLNDSSKFGLWNDGCLYMGANGWAGNSYAGVIFASFPLADMEAGRAVIFGIGFIGTSNDPISMIPSNLLGSAPGSLPPAGTPNYFVSESHLAFNWEVRTFTPGPKCGGGGSLSTAVTVNQTAYQTVGGGVSQPGTDNTLNTGIDRVMPKVQYRRVGDAESLWLVHDVRTTSFGAVAPHWAQIDVSGGNVALAPVQEQIYTPDTFLNRWLPSLAVDHAGNMAVGYSTANGTDPNYPSIAYSGRLAGDALNQLPQTEVQLVAGGGSQTNTCYGFPCTGWGDYASMSVDPSDDCTFWYSGEYYDTAGNGATGNWRTRIGSFKFPSCNSGLQFQAVAPCRLFDSRNPAGPLGGPFLSARTTRTIPVLSSPCGIPAGAVAYSVNATVVPRSGTLFFLSLWPAGQAQPSISTLNSFDGSILANAAIVPAGSAGAVNAYVTNDADLVLDINGYFVPPSAGTLQFYTLAPCRVIDTRTAAGPLGGPLLTGGVPRSFPIQSGPCGAPPSAAAYALNVTVVPKAPLAYLTAWPTGSAQPAVSTLNSFDGGVLANAAIVAAGTGGAVSFFASGSTDLIVDINGYFAPPAGGGLNFYPVTPCRVADTRTPAGPLGGPSLGYSTPRTFPVPSSPCLLPPTAAAYSLNVTAVPFGALGFLTAWPAGVPQPAVSTLNDPKGLPIANAVLAPAGTSGGINVVVTSPSDVVIDTNGYFQ